MKQTKENQTPKSDRTDFTNHQSELDKAKNERIKSNQRSHKAQNVQSDKNNITLKTNVSRKKTGGGKQVSPGT